MMGSTAVLPAESPGSGFDCASASDAAPRASREAIDSWRRRSRMTWNRPVSLIDVPAVMGNRLYPIYTSLTIPGHWPVHWSAPGRSDEPPSELQSLMRSSYAVFSLKHNNRLPTSAYKHYNLTHYKPH